MNIRAISDHDIADKRGWYNSQCRSVIKRNALPAARAT